MNEINPLSRKIGKGGKVLFDGEPLCLEAAVTDALNAT
jgi:hypothetical protein